MAKKTLIVCPGNTVVVTGAKNKPKDLSPGEAFDFEDDAEAASLVARGVLREPVADAEAAAAPAA
mgnify:CR=1 FL=1